MKKKAVLFDLDGVIIDSETNRDEITKEILKEFKIVYEPRDVKEYISGKNSKECAQYIVNYYNLNVSFELFESKRKNLILRVYRDIIPFKNGFNKLFELLKAELDSAMGIVTGCDREFYTAIDDRLHITDLFGNNVYFTQDIGYQKPSPEIIFYACSKIGVRPQDTVVFEDSPNGVTSALSAGCKIVALTNTFSKQRILESYHKFTGKFIEKDKILFIDDFVGNLEQILSYLNTNSHY